MPRTRTGKIIVSFQFPLLGIFHCTLCCGTFLGRLKRMLFQFPLLGIFHCTFHSGTESSQRVSRFQFPLLGIFHCTNNINSINLTFFTFLSIPVTWDFPLHRARTRLIDSSWRRTFNSRYLGFSIAPFPYALKTGDFTTVLSIPVTWDFPLHHERLRNKAKRTGTLSIPVTWDFPLHPAYFVVYVRA